MPLKPTLGQAFNNYVMQNQQPHPQGELIRQGYLNDIEQINRPLSEFEMETKHPLVRAVQSGMGALTGAASRVSDAVLRTPEVVGRMAGYQTPAQMATSSLYGAASDYIRGEGEELANTFDPDNEWELAAQRANEQPVLDSLKDPAVVLGSVANAVPTLAAAMLAGPVGSIPYITGMEASGLNDQIKAYEEATGQKVTQSAYNMAMAQHLPVAVAMERIGLKGVTAPLRGQILQKGAQILGKGGVEAGTEVAQEFSGNRTMQHIDPTQRLDEGLVSAGIGGGGSGVTMGAVQAQAPVALSTDPVQRKAQVQGQIDRLSKKLGYNIDVRSNLGDLTQEELAQVEQHAAEQGIDPNTVDALWLDGKIAVFSDKMGTDLDIEKKAHHEAAAHDGVRKHMESMGIDINPVYDSILAERGDEIAAWAAENGYQTGSPEQNRIVTDEWLAAQAEEALTQGQLTQGAKLIIGKIKQMFQGATDKQWSNADILQLLVRGREAHGMADAGAGSRFSFRGEGANLTQENQAALTEAASMEDDLSTNRNTALRDMWRAGNDMTVDEMTAQQEADNEKVRQAKGWFRGDEGKWKNEFNDSGASLVGQETPQGSNIQIDGEYRMEDILDHPELFESYPAIKDTPVHVTPMPPNERGQIRDDKSSPTGLSMLINSRDRNIDQQKLSTIMHEVQHIIQYIEGFARGGMTKEFMDNITLETEAKGIKITPEAEKVMRDRAFRNYQALSGEAEAREVQARMYMTDREKKSTKPMSRAEAKGFPKDKRIVKRQSEPVKRQDLRFSTQKRTGAKGLTGAETAEYKAAIEKGLPMNFDDRMKRAKEAGFDTDDEWYHASTHNITDMDASVTNPESDFGKGIYMTNNTDDAEANYAGEGPDLTSRITNRAEQIADERDLNRKDAMDAAREELVGEAKGGTTYPLLLNPSKMANIGGYEETMIESNDFREEAEDEHDRADFDSDEEYEDAVQEMQWEMQGDDMDSPLMSITDTLRRLNVEDDDVAAIMETMYDGEITATGIYDAVKNSEAMADGDDGNFLTPGGLTAKILQDLGYEGVFDHTVNEKFGSQRKYGQSMEGMNEGTVHAIVFEGGEHNIRSKHAAFDPDNKDKTNILFSTVPLREGTEDLSAYGIEPGRKRVRNRELAEALESRQRDMHGVIDRKDRSDESAQKIADWMADEVEHELHPDRIADSAKGWYGEKYQKAVNRIGQKFPEVKKNITKRHLLTAMIAITSDGTAVEGNFRSGTRTYQKYRKDGKLEMLHGHGEREASVKGNLKKLQALIDNLGEEGAAEFLTTEKPISEWRRMGIEVSSDYTADTVMPGSIIFGPKVGAFFGNLSGMEHYLTMDRWWSRTFNRLRGELTTKPTDVGIKRFKAMLGKPRMHDKTALRLAAEHADKYAKKKFKNGTAIEKAANTITKATKGLVDIPGNATDRSFMLNAARKTQEVMSKRGYDLSISDIQAIMWYYEKRFYKQMGTGAQLTDVSFEEAAKQAVEEL